MHVAIETVACKQERLSRATLAMEEHQIDALLLAKPQNVAYLAGGGCPGSFSVVTRGGHVALGVPEASLEAVRSEAWTTDIRTFRDLPDMLRAVRSTVSDLRLGSATVGVEYAFLTQRHFALFTGGDVLPTTARVKDASPVLDWLRSEKSADEVALLQRAAAIAGAGVETALRAVREGITESEVAGAGELAMREAGAEAIYHTCVVSGPRSALGFAYPTNRTLQQGDIVLIDMHPIVGGYYGDLCRTTSVGGASRSARDALAAYLTAHARAIRACRPGTSVRAIERIFARSLEATGHAASLFGPVVRGIGMEFAEPPLALRGARNNAAAAEALLPAHGVVVLGSGLLVPAGFGVRQEDMVLIAEDGPRVLTPSRYPSL